MKMRLTILPWLFSCGFIAYVVLATLALKLLEHRPPSYAEALISLFAAPLFYIFRPLYPLLKPLGLLEGEFWRAPSPLGLVICTLLYAGILFFMGVSLSHFLSGGTIKGRQ